MRGTAARAISLAALLALTAPGTADAIEHLGFSKEDRFIECASSVLGKRVLAAEEGTWPTIDTVPCPASKQSLIDGLASLKYTVVDCGAWVHLVPAYLRDRSSIGPRAVWERLRVSTKVTEWGSEGSRPLSQSERDQIVRAVVEQARPPVVFTPRGRVNNEAVDTIYLSLSLDIRTLGRGRKESVIAVWGHHLCRLVYGEIDKGVYHPLWDSPLFLAEFAKIGYLDVDADGVEEVVLESRSGRDGLEWVIFNVKGQEMSRQAPCKSSLVRSASSNIGITCPISGSRDPGINWKQRSNGNWDLIVRDWDGRRWGPIRYRLVNGRYVVTGLTAAK